MSREAMQMALEALESDPISHAGLVSRKQAITALRQALETEQEPVAWANSFDLQNFDMKVRTCPDLHHTVPLYTAPPKQWVSLTDEEISAVDWKPNETLHDYARHIELKLRGKNT
jgi:hypothetical protein